MFGYDGGQLVLQNRSLETCVTAVLLTCESLSSLVTRLGREFDWNSNGPVPAAEAAFLTRSCFADLQESGLLLLRIARLL